MQLRHTFKDIWNETNEKLILRQEFKELLCL